MRFIRSLPIRQANRSGERTANSKLNWSLLRLPFVYGDGDEHLAAVQKIIAMMKWHPARTFSLAHQRDVAGAFELALTGVMDKRVVNIVDDAPTTLYEMASVNGVRVEPSAALSRGLRFRPAIATLHQTAYEGNPLAILPRRSGTPLR